MYHRGPRATTRRKRSHSHVKPPGVQSSAVTSVLTTYPHHCPNHKNFSRRALISTGTASVKRENRLLPLVQVSPRRGGGQFIESAPPRESAPSAGERTQHRGGSPLPPRRSPSLPAGSPLPPRRAVPPTHALIEDEAVVSSGAFTPHASRLRPCANQRELRLAFSRSTRRALCPKALSPSDVTPTEGRGTRRVLPAPRPLPDALD